MKDELTSREIALRKAVMSWRLDDVEHLVNEYTGHIEHRLASGRMTAKEAQLLAERAHAVLTETQALARTIREGWTAELARLRSIDGYKLSYSAGRSSIA
jgi:hypothetical protein